MKKWKLRLIILLFLAAAVWGLIWGNTALQVSYYTVESQKLPESFDGFRIAQISDLHNTKFGKDNQKLLTLLAQCQPDIIAITGDLINARQLDISVALDFIREAVKIAPCYYVTGNHEARTEDFLSLQIGLREAGVTVLRNGEATLTRNGQSIYIVGLDDPNFSGSAQFTRDLAALTQEADSFTLLLSHRPERFSLYCTYRADLVLSGHAHGGQIRLPWIGGLFAPNQGWFPQYDAGIYKEGNTTMVVSRGLGNSAFPLRVNNRPELAIITLKVSTYDNRQ